jgi:hypothetical protein
LNLKVSIQRLCLALSPLFSLSFAASPDGTNFQTAAPYSASVDIAADVAIVYGTQGDFAERVAGWRAQGYGVAMMTGISWGRYSDYYGEGDAFKRDEVQTTATGELRMHGVNVGYNVPTPAYVEYIKQRVAPAVDAGVRAIYMEEPEYWANTGWSAAFKQEWQRYYGTPWQAPDSSVDAQYKASRLKYELYYNALAEVFRFAKQRAREQGREIECHVPTHSLINYAHWGIVSPESHLMDLPEMDGYIAQVWTGTARTPNRYRRDTRERTFESAYFEYGQAWSMVRPTGRKVWFLHDPIEDNPNHTWADYKVNYEATVVASLLWPAVDRFEVVPWPNRVFEGQYPRSDLERKPSGEFIETEREGIPQDYAAELLAVMNALADMTQAEVKLDAGEPGIAVAVSDTLMFQRAAPSPSDHAFGCFYGLSLPLLKHGIPAQVVQMETLRSPADLGDTRLLLLSYDGQKPLKPEYHAVLADWVRGGGRLLIADDNADPYNAVKEWWNENGATTRTPRDALLETLGVVAAPGQLQTVGTGRVLLLDKSPTKLSLDRKGADEVINAVAQTLEIPREELRTGNHIRLDRGPYTIAACMDESVSDAPYTISGTYVDLFDPALGVKVNPVLAPGQRGLYRRIVANALPQVLGASTRVRDVVVEGNALRFNTRGPVNTPCRIVAQIPSAPTRVEVDGGEVALPVWDVHTQTVRIEFQNQARTVPVTIAW